MSTENEGTPAPPAPSAPPVPVDAPATHPPAPAEAAPPAGAAPAGAAPAGGAPAGGPGPGAAPADHPHQDGTHGIYQEAPEQQTATLPTTGAPGTHAGGAPEQPAAPAYASYPPPQPPAAAYPAQSGAPVGDWPPPTVPAYAGNDGGTGWGSSYPEAHPAGHPGDAPGAKPAGRRRGGLVVAIAAAALVASALGGGVGYQVAKNNDDSPGSTTVAASDSPADLKREPGSVAGIAAAALPSVVTIDAKGGDGEGGTGTGFIYDREGHILTNNHVVASAADSGELSATFSNGKKYAAEVIGRAQGYDVAVLKLKNAPGDLKPLRLGNSDKVAVGDSTIAIGAPFGLSNTVTTGIVSAKDRPVASSDGGSSGKASYMSALQTDASINPGNSGGPLLDARGAVIGVNSAIQSAGSGMGGAGQAGSIGLGFAIPINQATTVAQTLIKTGKPVYAVIGASVSLEENGDGATITQEGAGGSDSVIPGGPAAKAGLQSGDVITKLDDTVIDSGPTLIGEIWTHKPGDAVKITYERDGKERTVDLVLGEREGDSS
ncbi:S1C family serine protease [Streptomyces sp. NPDC059578]|uniref:S1C family serine protease n=1 Tax=unclassified Streptomyces TaxID=2593676 RepID=UPI0036586B5E